MFILAIETSCDDTCAAVLENDRILSNVISSQTDLHSPWGGVVPDIAKRAHAERIEPVVATALKRAKTTMEAVDVIAVTQGPGLAIALGVGIAKAKSLALTYHKKLVAVNHIEGHLLSNIAKNSKGKPDRNILFPALGLTVSGGHTKLVYIEAIGKYKVVGETLDDAAGEALDKAAKMMGLGYPGGPIIEQLARGGSDTFLNLPRPMSAIKTLDYSFSGLKTSFYYQIKDWSGEKIAAHLNDLAATFQKAVLDTLLLKFEKAVETYQPKTLLIAGGVAANGEFRKAGRRLARKYRIPLLMPAIKVLNTDNAAMIGVAGYYQALRGGYVTKIEDLERDARLEL